MFGRLLDLLDGKSATLFLVSAVLLIIFAAFLGIEAAADQAMPEDAFGPPGFAIAALGLLGLHRTVAGESRRIAGIGAIGAGILFSAFFVISVTSIAEELGLMGPIEETGAIGAIIILLAGVATLLSYIPIGIASIRSSNMSAVVGVLLFGMPATFFVMLGTGASGDASAWSAFALGSTQALVHIAIAFALLKTAPQPHTSGRHQEVRSRSTQAGAGAADYR